MKQTIYRTKQWWAPSEWKKQKLLAHQKAVFCKKNGMVHTLIFLTIYSGTKQNSISNTNRNAQYKDIFANNKASTMQGYSTAAFQLLKKDIQSFLTTNSAPEI